jgi:maltose/moltooligosaccharide transporter
VGVLFAGYNGVAALVALLLPALARGSAGGPATPCAWPGRPGLRGFVLIDDPALLWIPIVGIGVRLGIDPVGPLRHAVQRRAADKMGVYMGIHNLFLVLPQLIAAAILGLLVEQVFGGQSIFALGLAAAALAIGSAVAVTIPDIEGDRRLAA